jgi:hypothetical protein
VYYTHTQQARRVADVMAETFRARGIEVQQAAIEFTDPRYAERFSRFPFRRPYIDLFGNTTGGFVTFGAETLR